MRYLLIGSNGLTLDPQGRLLITAMTDRAVTRLEKDGTRTVLADRYQGKRFNGPNDIVGKSDGAIYFTDTIWGMRGAEKSPDRELPYSGFFLIKDGKVTLLGEEKDSDTPTGSRCRRMKSTCTSLPDCRRPCDTMCCRTTRWRIQ